MFNVHVRIYNFNGSGKRARARVRDWMRKKVLYWYSTSYSQPTYQTHGACVMENVWCGWLHCAQSTSTCFVSFRSQSVRKINLEMCVWPHDECVFVSGRPQRARDIFLPFTHSYRWIFIAEMKKGHLYEILCRCWVNECFGFLFHHYYHRHHHNMPLLLLLLLLLILFVSLSNYPSFRNIFWCCTHICCLLVCLSQMNSECVWVWGCMLTNQTHMEQFPFLAMFHPKRSLYSTFIQY